MINGQKVNFYFGTWDKYDTLRSAYTANPSAYPDFPNTLYYITGGTSQDSFGSGADQRTVTTYHKGEVWCGADPVIAVKQVYKTNVPSIQTPWQEHDHVILEMSNGYYIEFDVPTTAAVQSLYTTLANLVSTHAAVEAQYDPNAATPIDRLGHVRLRDSINDSTLTAALGGYAATPAAVAAAVAAANSYTNQQLDAVNAMRFCGTVDGDTGLIVSVNPNIITSANISGGGNPVGSKFDLLIDYKAGWVWIVSSASVNDGDMGGLWPTMSVETGDSIMCYVDYDRTIGWTAKDWTIIQNNLMGAVTAPAALPADQLVLGYMNGTRQVKTLAHDPANDKGKILMLDNTTGNPVWVTPQGAGISNDTQYDLVHPEVSGVPTMNTVRLINKANASDYDDVVVNDVGHATTADTWTTARTLTIGSTGKSVNGSANVAWTLAEIGAAAAADLTWHELT